MYFLKKDIGHLSKPEINMISSKSGSKKNLVNILTKK